MEFEWDEAKAAGNLAKHGLSFEAATAVFLDPARIDFDATQPGQGEARRKAVGAVGGRVIAVVYTQRRGIVRLISARRANRKECEAYG